MSRIAIITLFALVVCATALRLAAPHVNDDMVAEINAKQSSWTASTEQGSNIEGASTKSIKNLLGVKRFSKKYLEPKVFTDEELAVPVPESFDAAEQWPNCPTITNIRDQSACGSCWAVAAAEAMSDRYCTAGGPANLEISAANLMECCWYCGSGCQGGDPASAWNWWVYSGLFSTECQPYPFAKCEHHIPKKNFPECPKQIYPTPSCNGFACSSGATGNTTKYKGNSSYSLSGVQAYQAEVMKNGPIEVTFDVYSDFPAYKSGVYVQSSNNYLGGHAVRLVGWGTLNGTKYWKIANSWNRDWGMNGYFLIKRGTDECGIEDNGSAGIPQLPA